MDPLKYHDPSTVASDPVGITLSTERFRRLQPDTRGLSGWWAELTGDLARFEERLAEHVRLGDSRAAVVLSTCPLIVAAYSDEIDCAVLLRFPEWLADEHWLEPGTGLLTINTYERARRFAADLTPGPHCQFRWQNVYPVIAEFISNDIDRIAARKRQIARGEWRRCTELGIAALRARKRARDGSPLRSSMPAV